MKRMAIALVALVAAVCMIPAAGFALTPYSQDFEGLTQSDTGALGANGWLVYANVFTPSLGYLYGYGVFPAPNDGAAFCAIAAGEGGAGQGAQQLVKFSDYNNGDHAAGNIIEALLFQEQPIVAGDVGMTWQFDFQAKLGNLAAPSTAVAYIKTLNPSSGYATTNYITLDMTTIPTTWSDYSLTITIDASLVGQLLQIGFQDMASNYVGSGVFYDNIEFHLEGAIPADDVSWGEMKTLFR